MKIENIQSLRSIDSLNNIENKVDLLCQKKNNVKNYKKNQSKIKFYYAFEKIKNYEKYDIDIKKVKIIKEKIKNDILNIDLDKIANELIFESIFFHKK